MPEKYERICTKRFIEELGLLTVEAPTYEISMLALHLQLAISNFEIDCNNVLKNKVISPPSLTRQ